VKKIIKTEKKIKYFFVRLKQEIKILDLALTLNKIRSPVIKTHLRLFNATERNNRRKKDAVNIIIKSLSALILPLTAAIFKIKIVIIIIISIRPTDKLDSGLDLTLDK
jgi:hypothetical protein